MAGLWKAMGYCETYCVHGGICRLPHNHAGLHSSGMCEWPDEESITRQQADAAAVGNPLRMMAAEMIKLLEAVTGYDD